MALCCLVACGGGGGGGGGVTLASGDQDEDPVVLEIPIAFVRRPIPDEPPDLRDPLAFNPGAELILRERASPTAENIDMTRQIRSIVAEELDTKAAELAVDIKGLESAFDGKTIVFAARVVPEPVAANLDASTWNLWQLDVETQQVSYVMPSRIQRNEGMESGGAQDIAPHFLPDDRIVFSSTRQIASQARQLNEGRAQIFSALDEDRRSPAAVLHIYDPRSRGEELQQISFNLSHDLDPTVLADGDILFSRWNNTISDHISLFRIAPSGARLAPVYGFHSQNAGTEGARIVFTQARELDDGRLASVVRDVAAESLGGEIVLIDSANFADNDQPLWQNRGAAEGAQESLTETAVRSDQQLSPGGQYGSVYPLRDGTGRLLVTWSECRVVDEAVILAPGDTPAAGDLAPCSLQTGNTRLAPPLYGAWVYDPAADTQKPVVLAREGFWISEVITAENRDFPDVRGLEANYSADLALQGLGQLLIGSVYDIDGTDTSPQGIANHARPGTDAFRQRPARFLRLVTPVPLPDPDVYAIPNYAVGVSGGFGFREILGYVPVEPDGSVTVILPADRPFSFDILDQRGRRIGARHNFWLQLAPGETRQCAGCHDHGSGLPHGLPDSQAPSANPGARAVSGGSIGFPATNTDLLFAPEAGATMAETWDFHMPSANPAAAARELNTAPAYTDRWSASRFSPEATIADRFYDAAWTDIPPERSILARGFDATQAPRSVINYPDHIQPIWERTRTPVADAAGVLHERCVSCHASTVDMPLPAGQLDLTAAPSDIEPNHPVSYRELLSNDNEQWLDGGGAVADRLRTCTSIDADGNSVVTTQSVSVAATMRAGSANASTGFFNCFEGGSCGRADAPPLPDNCVEDGEPVPATRNTVNHSGLLSEAELNLISEWLDIGAQFFNNPFDSRLQD
ncbi:hypothetical protein F0M18_06875 [Pseudohalioglobus sediminis]|uniref:Cytochrome c domain-containing protein n=1 Tax=Pseudohalioglobus sediminis TaxID=2606449 RepID=A0A5B0WZB5_9GAMM|nr:hypothetical protein [Pseudohalioglobus sediminis]KAA1192393.1 hypothetical protein F0M18_06875 [Pseudohalioglobus sediminis]